MPTYPGGKGGAGVYQTIINQLPPHSVYVSATAGLDAVMRHKRPAQRNIAIDLDTEPLTWWQQNRADVECWNCCGLQWLRTTFGLDRVDLVPSPRSVADPTPTSLATIPGHRDRTTSKREAAEQACRDHAAKSDWLVLIDAPYPVDVRSSKKRMYTAEQMDWPFHHRLLKTAAQLPCLVVVCCYPNKEYDTALKGWRRVNYFATARSGQRRRERLWMNFPRPEQLHDYSFLGSDKREREMIAKRSRSLRGKLERLKGHERQALIEVAKEFDQ